MKKYKTLILRLIKDDLMNTQLINGLNALGLDAGNYYLHLNQIFFTLMGFGDHHQEQKLYAEYYDTVENALTTNMIETPEQLDILALTIYDYLKDEKEKRKKSQLREQI